MSGSRPVDWRFADPPDVAVFTTDAVARRGAWIARVSHDADDGAWQFHGSDDAPAGKAMMVSLGGLVGRDPSLRLLADLPEGWCARRTAPDAPWQRAPA